MMTVLKQLTEVLREFLRDDPPELAIVLGSGLGQIAEYLKNPRILPYDDAPGMKVSGTAGHNGRFILGEVKDKTVLFLQGRMHYYEGHEMDEVVLAIRAMACVGIRQLILTNAAGAVNRAYRPADIALIKDHIGLFCPSPLRGANLDDLGPRFPDQTHVYDPALMLLAKEVAEAAKIKLREGVYCFTKGPQYETPAEIDMLGRLGADLVGMSTVPEAIAASHAGMRVLAFSGITNMAAGIAREALSHDEVLRNGRKLGVDMLKLLVGIIEAL